MAAVINMPVKQRTIGEKDWQTVEEHIKKEFKKRETDSFRKQHESVWKEVDRQIYMQPMKVVGREKVKGDWHSAIELGELAKASEIIAADVMRLAFPNNRSWFESHVELPAELDTESGTNAGQKMQQFVNGSTRAFMSQQHIDFGLKARFYLSVKESLSHGSFVAEARQESAMLVHGGSGISSIAAPVWVPHSMWNCYPDPSPSVLGTNMLYTGTMIIREFIPMWKLKEIAKGNGWMTDNLAKIKTKRNKNKDVDTEDVELIKWYGDVVIKQGDGDVYLPNSKVILGNGTIIYYAPNSLPFPPILFNGYERMDVRDPYFTSPLIKLSPMHKLASTMANKTVDSIGMHVEPPILYDSNDPQFVADGGPVLSPGAKTGTKYMGKGFQQMIVGDPNAAITGLQLIMDQLRQGTSVDSIRAGVSGPDKTATQARIESARGEVRVIDFVDRLEFSLKSFLYMQHEINKTSMDSYSFYNPEMDAPDFMRVTREDLPENIHFEVVGSKGVLGEEERAQKMSVVTAFASGNPMFAPLLDPIEILKEMYQDAGVKSPERFMKIQGENPELEAAINEIQQQHQQMMQEIEAQMLDLKKELAITKAVNDAKVVEAQTKAQSQAEIAGFKAEIQAQVDSIKSALKIAETEANLKKNEQS